MRKRTVLLALGAALLLAGCAGKTTVEELDGQEMTVYLPQETTALFTGTVEDHVASGLLESDDGWRFQGEVADGRLLSGTAEALPWSVQIQNTELSGRYTGPVTHGLPEGTGSFSADSGVEFTGIFTAGGMLGGEIWDLPMTLLWDGGEYSGIYSGTIYQGKPSETGSFSGSNAAGQHLFWEGGWHDGAPSGEGTLQADKLVTRVEGVSLAGTYSGEGRDGAPAGEGTFCGANAEGISFTYEGQWENGLMDGRGTLRYDSDIYYTRLGTFTEGSYAPTWLDCFETLGTYEPEFTLTDGQRELIAQYPSLWQRASHTNFSNSEYRSAADRELTLQKCFDDPQSFLDDPRWMCIYSLRVISWEYGPVTENGMIMTRVTAADGMYTMPVRVIVPERLPSVKQGWRLNVYAIPIAVSEYTTVLGQRQKCLVLLAGDISWGG